MLLLPVLSQSEKITMLAWHVLDCGNMNMLGRDTHTSSSCWVSFLGSFPKFLPLHLLSFCGMNSITDSYYTSGGSQALG